ncbi:hypothetical protein ACWT_1655 [Actinoplanes sp. SE50]|nr:hypothetical protein ACPL_1777 [Actinoplanes sp. SE50/110]ATO81070.1 hypothetical protein ACWT_1655 [Actinoplanes sp. SE50]SLL98477.1 hypothetical protein ACSP50_1703 [Actinoplanes sp. SE50/110]
MIVDQPPAGPSWWRPQRGGSHRSLRRTLATGLGSAAVIAALGAPVGLLWHTLAPRVEVVDAGSSGFLVTDPAEQFIAADGWLTLLGLGFGLLVAVLAWLVLRRDRGPALLLGVVAGAAAGIRWVAVPLGQMIGRADYTHWKATAAKGDTYLAPPQIHAHGPTLVAAFVAAIVLTLLAGWSNDPDLDSPGAQPGYGPNHGQYEAEPPGSAPFRAQQLSSDSPGAPDPTAAPAPPAPGPADQPRG